MLVSHLISFLVYVVCIRGPYVIICSLVDVYYRDISAILLLVISPSFVCQSCTTTFAIT